MTGERRTLRTLKAPGAAAGSHVLEVGSDELVSGARRLVAGANVTLDTSVDGVLTVSASGTAGAPVVTVVDGVPGLVFDDDGEIVYTEVP